MAGGSWLPGVRGRRFGRPGTDRDVLGLVCQGRGLPARSPARLIPTPPRTRGVMTMHYLISDGHIDQRKCYSLSECQDFAREKGAGSYSIVPVSRPREMTRACRL